jgi:hypothetical protein
MMMKTLFWFASRSLVDGGGQSHASASVSKGNLVPIKHSLAASHSNRLYNNPNANLKRYILPN